MNSVPQTGLESNFSLMHSLLVFYGISKSSSILELCLSFLFILQYTFPQVYLMILTLFTSKTTAKILVNFYSSY